MPNPKDPAAQDLGRKGGKARARALTPSERSISARHAANARWNAETPPLDDAWREDLVRINEDLDIAGDCSRCGCPLTNGHLESACQS